MISHGSLGMRTITFVWLAIIVVSSYTIIEGRHISREDYLEAKRLVKLSRRPSVKIIQDENEDIIDCVIIHKQLAFEHPALKNHTIQMKPTFVPKWKKDKGSNNTNLYIGLKDGGCPIGSVPIRRLQISDILGSTSVSSFGRKDAFEHHYATIHYYGEFLGARASMNIWNPNVGNNQFSLSQLWIVNQSPFGPLETIEVGWAVHPELFDDHETRLFTFWTNDNYGTTGTYNYGRPGFTRVSHTFSAGSEFRPTSTYDGPQHYVDISVYKDSVSRNWWLIKGEDLIGYWPHRIFNRLSIGRSTIVTWGGEVGRRFHNQLLPQMGSGYFPDINNIHGKSCTISKMQVFYGGTRWEDIGHFQLHESTPNCFKVVDGGRTDEWGRHIAFGGPGGQC